MRQKYEFLVSFRVIIICSISLPLSLINHSIDCTQIKREGLRQNISSQDDRRRNESFFKNESHHSTPSRSPFRSSYRAYTYL